MKSTPTPRPTVPLNVTPPASLRFLYRTPVGRAVLKGLVAPPVSRLCGRYMDSPLSRRRIAPFVKKARIDLSLYEPHTYRSYNDFFTRQIRPSARPIDRDPTHLIAPCDAKLSVYRLTGDRLLPVKGAPYSLPQLLQDTALARHFANGYCFIFRLAVDDYHRYSFPDDGTGTAPVRLPGILHTVQPVATERLPVYHRNTREYTLLHTEHFGDVVQMEVGALCVGRICNHPMPPRFTRGQEKGYFEFGGSTVILLLQDGAVLPDDELLRNTEAQLETVVHLGERIGIAPQS